MASGSNKPTKNENFPPALIDYSDRPITIYSFKGFMDNMLNDFVEKYDPSLKAKIPEYLASRITAFNIIFNVFPRCDCGTCKEHYAQMRKSK
jgi:hypothetical protein